MHRKHGRYHYHCFSLGVVDSLVVADCPRMCSANPAGLPAAHNISSLTPTCSGYLAYMDRVRPWDIHDRRRAPRTAKLLVVLGRREMVLLLPVSGWDVVKVVSIDTRELDLDCRFGIVIVSWWWSAGGVLPCCNNRWQP